MRLLWAFSRREGPTLRCGARDDSVCVGAEPRSGVRVGCSKGTRDCVAHHNPQVYWAPQVRAQWPFAPTPELISTDTKACARVE